MTQELVFHNIKDNNPIQFWEGYSAYKDINLKINIDDSQSKGKIQTTVSNYVDEKIKVGLEGMIYSDKTEAKIDSLIMKAEKYQNDIQINFKKTEDLLRESEKLDNFISGYQSDIDKLMASLKDDYDIVSKIPKEEVSVVSKLQQEIRDNQAKIDALIIKKELAEQKTEQIAREITLLKTQSGSLQIDFNNDVQNIGQEILGLKLEQERFDRLINFDFKEEFVSSLSSQTLTLKDFEVSSQESFLQSIMQRDKDAFSSLATNKTLDIDENIIALISPTLLNVATQLMNSKISEFEISSKRYLDLANGNMSDAFNIFFRRNYDDIVQNKLNLKYFKSSIDEIKHGVKDFWNEEKTIYTSSKGAKMKVASLLMESKLGQASVLALTVGLSSYGLAAVLPVMGAGMVIYGIVRPLMKSIQHFAYSQTRLTKGEMGIMGYEKEKETLQKFIKITVDPETSHNSDLSKIKLKTEYSNFERRMYNLGVFYASLKHHFSELIEPLKNLKDGFMKLKDLLGNLIEYSNQKRIAFSQNPVSKIDIKEHNKNVVSYVISRLNDVNFDRLNIENTVEHLAYLISKGNKEFMSDIHSKPTEVMELTQINNLIRDSNFREHLVNNGFDVSDISNVGRNIRLKLVGVKDALIESPFVLKENKV